MTEREQLGFQPKVLAVWCAGSVFFIAALFAAAKTGVRLANERVPPESVRPEPLVKTGIDLKVKGKLVFARTQQELREYYFREETTAGAGIGSKGDDDVFEIDGPVVVHTVRADIDLVMVEIVTGPRVGERFWIRGELLGAGF